ncbi:hypothetical protein Dimus_003189 [Dionaea muscipula]
MDSKLDHEYDEDTTGRMAGQEKKTRMEMQAAVASAKRELENVKLNIEKATDEMSCLNVAATSLRTELEKERSELANLKQREGMGSVVMASLEAELERIKSEIVELRGLNPQFYILDSFSHRTFSFFPPFPLAIYIVLYPTSEFRNFLFFSFSYKYCPCFFVIDRSK